MTRFQRQAPCAACKQRPATKEDGLCDSCRYSKLLGNILEDRK